MRSGFLRRLALAALLLALATATPAAATSPGRIVAVGDVHGDLASLTSILQATGIIDEQLRWIGGDTVLVQTGDVLDRGVEIRGVLDLLMRLQQEALASGGQVHTVLGNHEVMNLVLEFRDINDGQYVTFASADSEARRVAEYDEYAALAPVIDALDVEDALGFAVLDRDAWLAANPAGRLEYIEAISPDGAYGAWLREHPFAVKLDGALFLHAGISDIEMVRSIEDIDREVHAELAAFDAARAALTDSGWALPSFHLNDLIRVAALLLQHADAAAALVGKRDGAGERLRPYAMPDQTAAAAMLKLVDLPNWTSFRPDGPLWYRGYDPRRPVMNFDEGFARLLARYDVEHIVVGHTPQPGGRIRAVLDGALFLIDTGMLRAVYNGQPAALEIANGAFTAAYLDSREWLCCGEPPADGPPPAAPPRNALDERAWRNRTGEPLPFTSDAEIEQFLLQAEVVESEKISTGITQPTRVVLDRAGVRARGIFRDVDETFRNVRLGDGDLRKNLRDYYGFELAAYAVDRLLGLGMVPPTVPWRFETKAGALQLWVEGVIMEKERAERGMSPQPAQLWRLQSNRMNVFDYIIGNDDRHAQNMLIDADRWLLWLIDHTRAFQRDSPKVAALLDRINTIDDEMWAKLRALDKAALEAALEEHIEGIRVREVLERYDNVIARIEGLIEERGVEAVIYPAR